jgi:homocysteine S-methyltransferase
MTIDNLNQQEQINQSLSHPFLNKIRISVVLGDGGMGTQLYERGVFINRSFDALNLTDAYLVKAVHRDYIHSGAEVIETNTFGANPVKLAKHGLAEKTLEINRAGAEIARRCADEASGVLVAGSIGPVGKPLKPVGTISAEEACDAFSLQVKGLLEGEIDFFILETFIDLEEIKLAIQAVREQSALPIVAMMTVDNSGKTAYGRTPEIIAETLSAEAVDVIGLNCSTGPQTILDGIIRMRKVTTKPLSAFPNAGEPELLDGRIIYLSTPEYLAEYTKRFIQNGALFIGGCCGTTPKHIQFMSSAIRALQPALQKLPSVEIKPRIKGKEPLAEVLLAPRSQRSRLGRMLDENKFPVSCELNPPRSPNTDKIIHNVKLLQKAGMDVVNIPDGPRASARMSPMALAYIVKKETGMEAILHYTCRDRNILGIQSDLLGAQALGLNNLLMVTGDPPKLGDYPMATAVFDVDAIGLLKIADNLNHSKDLAGNPIPRPTSFYLGAGFNPAAIDLEKEIDRLHKKISAGAEYILTQPVFDAEKFFNALEKIGELNIPLFLGILPLASYRNAEFFHNEVPGMEVPAQVLQRMKSASDKSAEAGTAEGVAIAREMLSSLKKYAQGAYIMPPFGRVELAIETASVLEGRKGVEEVLKGD